jgi:ribosomal protein S18 acetylase RimI-like enzyme
MPQFISLTDPVWTAFLPVARAIYEQAFEPEEKAPFEGLLAAACTSPGENPVYFWGLLEGEELLATAWFCTLQAERLGYLGYIATAPASRGRGHGGLLLRQVLAAMRDQLLADTGQPPLAIFWEVRSLDDAPEEEERLLRLRRIRFYQRFGAQTLDVDYLCPPVAPGQPEVKFTLMAVTDPPGQPLSQEILARIVLAGLVKMEGADPHSEYVRRALASIH